MNKEEAANVLGVSTKTVVNYSNLGLLEVTYIKGKTRPVADYDANAVHELKTKIDSGEIQIGKRESGTIESGNKNQEADKSGNGNRESALVPISRNRTENRETENRELGNVFVIGVEQMKELLEVAGQGNPIQELAAKTLLTFPEAATFTGISEKRLRDAAKSGELPTSKTLGRAQKLRRVDLDKWVNSQF